MVIDFIINVSAGLFLIGIMAVISRLYYLLTRRNKLLKFFGIKKPYKLVIYPSNLKVGSFGAIGIDGHARSYQGSAGAYKEILVANRFRELFNYSIPSLSETPGIWSKLLISDVQIEITLSPMTEADIEKSTSVITLGTPAYNKVSEYVESVLHSKVRTNFGVIDRAKVQGANLSDGEIPQLTPSGIISGSFGTADYQSKYITDTAAYSSTAFEAPGGEIKVGEKKTEIIFDSISPISDPNTGFVERILDSENNRQVFYVAGLTEDSTANAAYFLADKWLDLHKKHKERDFVVMLHFDKTDDRHPNILFER